MGLEFGKLVEESGFGISQCEEASPGDQPPSSYASSRQGRERGDPTDCLGVRLGTGVFVGRGVVFAVRRSKIKITGNKYFQIKNRSIKYLSKMQCAWCFVMCESQS